MIDAEQNEIRVGDHVVYIVGGGGSPFLAVGTVLAAEEERVYVALRNRGNVWLRASQRVAIYGGTVK